MASTTVPPTRPLPHRNLSRLQISPSPSPMMSQDQRTPVPMDGQTLYMAQSPAATAFHPAALGMPTPGPMTPNPMLNGPPTATMFQFPPNIHPSMHRPRQSLSMPPMGLINPAAIPLPSTPGVGQMQFNSPAFPFGAPPNALPHGLPNPLLNRPGLHPRRSQSISLGGPPKAVLGGPKPREPSTPIVASSSSSFPLNNTTTGDMPTATAATFSAAAAAAAAAGSSSSTPAPIPLSEPPKGKMKKCSVKLPVESRPSNVAEADFVQPSWARHPVPTSSLSPPTSVPEGLDISTGEAHPDHIGLAKLPLPPIDVSLPKKESWQIYKAAIIEEKLAKLGVVEPSMPTIPFMMGHAHGRAASISSPADPALLQFKLNKLQLQSPSQLGSPLTGSPSLSAVGGGGQNGDLSQPSSVGGSPFARPRHMQTMSLAPGPGGMGPYFGTNPHQPPPQFMSPPGQHTASLPRLSPFGGTTSDVGSISPDAAPFVPLFHNHRSPLPPSSLRSVSETEDEYEEEEEGKGKAENEEEDEEEEVPNLPLFAPQATTPIRASHFEGVTAAAEARAEAEADAEDAIVTAKDDKPNFAVGFGLDQDDEMEPAFGQVPDTAFGFTFPNGVSGASSNRVLGQSTAANLGDYDEYRFNGGNDDEGQEVEMDEDDVRTEGAFITPSHSRQVSRALSAALNQPPPKQRHQPGLSTASVQSMMRIDDLRGAASASAGASPRNAEFSSPNGVTAPVFHLLQNGGVEAAEEEEELIQEAPPELELPQDGLQLELLGSELADENYARREREMSVFTDDYAGGDEKENIPPSAISMPAHPTYVRSSTGDGVLHGDLGYVWPRPSVSESALGMGGGVSVDSDGRRSVTHTQVGTNSLAGGPLSGISATEDWTNPSVLGGHDINDGDIMTNSENEVGAGYGDAHSDNESEGEWSNPSDEERAREDRRLRKARAAGLHHPAHSASLGSAFGNPPGTHHHDDIISNPSEEEQDEGPSNYYSMEGPSAVFSPGHPMSASPAASGSTGHFRPLPLPPSQTASPVPHQLAMLGGHSRSTSLSGRERLNPLAKPFVFGAGASAFNPVVQRPDSNASNSPRSATPSSLRPTHSRQGSMNSKLNAGAAEFKPSFLSSSAFNFRPPPGLPTMAFPAPVVVAPHSPHPQLNASIAGNSPPTRAQQGREKRQRKLSSLDLGGEGLSEKDDGDSAPLFDFPPEWSSNAEPAKIEEEEEERIPMMRRKSVLNPDAKPFTMGVAAAPAVLAQLALPTSSSAPATVPASLRSKRSGDEMNGEEDDSDEDAEHEGLVSRLASLSPESAQKGRRPPIPDFQLSAAARKKTVPASVFHALASADSETSVRPAVRSRLSARENLFAEPHSRNASLDDFNVPSIALRSSRGNKTAPLQPRQAGSPFGSVVDDVFTQSPEANQLGLPFGRQASVQRARPISSLSTNSEGDQWVKPAAELALDEGLLDLLDDKFDSLRKDLLNRPDDLTPADVRDALMDFLPVLSGHIQTQLTAHHNLISGNDSLTDAKGEIDYEHLNSIIENGHHDLRSALQRDIAELAQALEHQASPHSVFNLIDNTHKEMVAHFHSSTKSILSHFDAIEDAARRRPAEERQKLLQELMHVLLPQLHQLRPEPFDVDTITMHLAEAVKPHISQLINLTSDKHETAGLIADQLRPQIAALQPSPFDIQAISNRLSSELQMATSGIDVHTIKEAVSDLVVERLDARLANRDNLSDHLEELAKRISTSLTPSLEHSEKLAAVQDAVSARINDILANHTSLQSEQSELSTKLSSLPESLSTASVALAEARDELKSKARDLHEMQDLQRVMEAHVSVQMELAQSKASVIELTAEKDVLTKRLAQLEAEAEARQVEVARLLARVSAQDDLVAHADDRVAGMEKSRVEAESKQQALEASLLVKDQQIESLQSDKHTLQGDSKDLQSKLADVQTQLQTSQKDLAAAEQAKQDLVAQRDQFAAQQEHWVAMQKTAEQVALMMTLLQGKANTDADDLAKFRDRTNVLEGELSTVQKQSSEQEKKVTQLQKAATTSKATILSAQQRAAEWEKKLNETKQELDASVQSVKSLEETRNASAEETENLKTRLGQMEESERDSAERESQLKNRVSSLDSQLQALKAELEKAKSEAAAATAAARSYPTPRSARAHSRSPSVSSKLRHSISPDNDDDDTKTEKDGGNSDNDEGTWDSMHAPPRSAVNGNGSYSQGWFGAISSHPSVPSRVPATPRPASAKPTPIPRKSFKLPAASPTGSTISLAPTQGSDGWWS